MYEEFVDEFNSVDDFDKYVKEYKKQALEAYEKSVNYRVKMTALSHLLPGAHAIIELPDEVSLAVHNRVGAKATMREAVMLANDMAGWSREKIADWLDNIHDSGTLDLSFAGRDSEDCQGSNEKN